MRPLHKTQLSWGPADSFAPQSFFRSCGARSLSSSNIFLKHVQRGHQWGNVSKSKAKEPAPNTTPDKTDHRLIGALHSLFTTDLSSPGTPFFLPDGTHIFQKLTSFLRAQYPMLGFREVLTPTIYKEELWRQSGHWDNYKDDMFMVERGQKLTESYGLKPMNCPGHCILFRSKRRSYKELPIRYAEFSPLHRNEISGALSGLTRVRRFHQDDGHIFCRPNQVMDEVLRSIQFVQLVYQALGFNVSDLSFALSTRPKEGYIGEVEEWDMAEAQLKEALDRALDHDESNGRGRKEHEPWTISEGNGAFYGPKIDVILRDNDRKQHQTATIQLDFQLPKRFQLEYEAPAPALEAKGLTTDDPVLLETMGRVAPVMIHRAVLGSLERFIALLLERDSGRLPLWLSPRQMIILTVTDNPKVVKEAQLAKNTLSNLIPRDMAKPRPLNEPPTFIVDLDASGDSIANKVARAKKSKYNLIGVMGLKNLKQHTGGVVNTKTTMDLEVNRDMQPDLEKTWDHIEIIQPGSQAPRQKDKGIGGVSRGHGVRLEVGKILRLMTRLCNNYL